MPDPLLAAVALIVFAGPWLWAVAGTVWEAVRRA